MWFWDLIIKIIAFIFGVRKEKQISYISLQVEVDD